MNQVNAKWLAVVDEAINNSNTSEETKQKFELDKVNWSKGDTKISLITSDSDIKPNVDVDPIVEKIIKK